MKLSIVIPVYNEEKTILTLLERVQQSVKKIDYLKGVEYVIVDDGSHDNTRAVLEKQYANNPDFKLTFKTPNAGKGAALATGFKQTTGDVVLIQDADLEYDPEDYSVLLGPFQRGLADVVYGSRFKGEVSRVLYYYHYLGNQFLTFLSNLFTNINLSDMETCYKVFKGNIIRNMVLESQRFGIEPEMTAKISKVRGIRIYEVPINYSGRTYEEGKKIGWKDGFSALWCIVKYNLLTSYAESFVRDPL